MTNITGSKGCFRKGSQVQLEHGVTKAIEDIKVGDEILSFNEEGEICLSKVTETHYHEDPEPLIRVYFWKGSIDITPNHWVLNQYGNFVDIGRLSLKDALMDGMGHLRPIISVEVLEAEPVYNLTVDINHTFICNNIRVHNGGYSARYPIVGSKGGGKGGGSRPAVEDPDSLRSIAYAKVVDLLCEGEIEGLATKDAKSIYLDEVQLQNNDGSFNFSGYTWDIRTGSQQQGYMEGFAEVESAREVNVRVKGATPANGNLPALLASPVERSYTNTNGELDGVRVTIGVPALYTQDTSTGDTHGTTVDLNMQMSHAGSGFYEAPIREVWTKSQTHSNIAISTITTNMVSCNRLYINLTFLFDKVWDNSGPVLSKNSFISAWGGIWHYADIQYTIEETINNGATWSTIKTGTVTYQGELTTVDGYIVDALNNVIYDNSDEAIVPTYSLGDLYGTYTTTSNKAFRITTSSGKILNFTVYGLTYDGKITISGKASSRYQKTIFVPFREGPGEYKIKLNRTTDESVKGNLVNQTWWDLETEVTYGKLRYPNSAYVGLSIDSSQFDSIPSRAYDVKLLKIKIPSNYNPLNRQYTGVWDGTFKVEWSNNPAWCLYDLITNDRYGLGSYVDDSIVDKWSLYTIGKYCDELVPTSTGDGLVEPRFTCNMYIQSREDAFKVINDMASIFRGMVYWASGSLTAVQDSPSDATHIFNQSNVIDGLFTYSGSSAKARHTVALISWNDPHDMCRPKVEYIEDVEAIAKYGIIEAETVAVGCTSRGQAHRVGEWLLYSEKYETDLVAFKTGMEGATARPGTVIKIADPARSGVRLGGRILESIDTTHIKLDSSITLNDTFTLNTFKADGTIQSATIASIDVNNIVTLSTPLAELPAVGSIWVSYAITVELQLFKVLSVIENSENEYEITAINHEPTKYDYIERDLKLQKRDFSNLSGNPDSPTGLKGTESLYISQGIVTSRLSASWEPVPFANKYKVTYKQTEGSLSAEKFVDSPHIDIDIVTPGEYEIRVWAINAINRLSISPAIASIIVYGKTLAPQQITNITSSVSNTKVLLKWDESTELDIWGYEVRTSDSNWGTSTNYVYKGTDASCLVDPPLPSQSYNYYIKAIDTSDNYSGIYTNSISSVSYVGTTVRLLYTSDGTIKYPVGSKVVIRDFVPNNYNGTYTVTGAATNYIEYTTIIPAIDQESIKNYGNILTHKDNSKTSSSSYKNFQSQTVPQVVLANITADLQETSTSNSTILLKWLPVVPEFGLDYYEFTNGTATPIRLNSTYVTITADWTSARNLSWVTVDRLGNRSTTTTKTVTIGPPGTVIATTTLIKLNNSVAATFDWDPPTMGSLPIAGYELRKTNSGWGTDTLYEYRGNTTTVTLPSMLSYVGQTWYIKAFDTRNNFSTAAGSVLIGNLVAPANITGFTSTIDIPTSKIKLGWNYSTELDVVYYEVRTDINWGNTTNLVYRGIDNEILYTPDIAISSYTFYIKAFDVTNLSSVTAATSTFTYSAITPIPLANITSSFNTTLLSSAEITLTWPVQSPQFGLGYYKIDYTGLTNAITTTTNTITLPANWVMNTSRDFVFTVYDTNGKASTTTTKSILLSPPSFTVGTVPTVTASKVLGDIDLTVSWVDATGGSLPIDHYEVRFSTDTNWGSGSGYLYKGAGTKFTIPKAFTSNYFAKILQVRAYDTAGNYSANIETTLLQPGAPNNAASFDTITIENNLLKLSWADSTSWDVTAYEIRTADSSWGATGAAQKFSSYANSCYLTPETPTGTIAANTTYYLKSWDAIGTQSSSALSQVFTYSTVTPVTLSSSNVTYDTTSLTSPTVTVNWTAPTTQFGIKHYELQKGIGNPVIISNSTSFSTIADWGASSALTFGITVVDVYGKKSTQSTVSLSITKPTLSVTVPSITLSKTSGVVGVNVSWPPATKGSLPIGGYEIRTTTATGAWGVADQYLKYRGQSTSFTLGDGSAVLGQTWFLNVFDTQGNFATSPQSLALETIGPPAAAGTITTVEDTNTGNLKIDWLSSSSLDVMSYDIREGIDPADWSLSSAGRVYKGNTLSTSLDLPSGLTLPKTYTYYVRPVDIVGKYSTTSVSKAFTYTAIPIVSGINWNLFDDTNVSATVKIYWNPVTPQFGLKYYKVYDGFNTYYPTDAYIELAANWGGTSRTFTINAVDNNDNLSANATASFTLYNPATVGVITKTVLGQNIKLAWPANTITSGTGYLPIAGYEIRDTDTNWGSTGFSYRGFSTEYIFSSNILVDGSSNSVSKTFYIKAFDTDNNYSTSASSTTVTPTVVPAPTAPTYTFFSGSSTSVNLTLKWAASTPEYGLKNYKIVYSDAYGSDTIYTDSQTTNVPANWVGDRAFSIYAIDTRGVSSAALPVTVTKLAPKTIISTNFLAQVVDNTVMLSWVPEAVSTLPVSHYILKSGKVIGGVEPTWATANIDLGRKDGAFTTITEVSEGTYKYFIKAVDTSNTESSETSKICEVSEPPDFIFNGFKQAQFNGTFTNSIIEGGTALVLPVNTTEQYQQHFTNIRVSAITVNAGGTGYAVGDIVELTTGTYTFKARLKVTSINAGVVTGVQIVQPGIYSVAPTATAGATLKLTGSGTGLTINATSGTWASPNDQVNAGYPIFISPAYPYGTYGTANGSYVETFDFSTVLPSSQITLAYSKYEDTAYSTVLITPTISVSSDNTNWTDFVGTSSIFATNFRYVKVKLEAYAAESKNIARLSNISLTLNAKLKNDGGMVYCNSTDTLGSIANFNKEFVDITSVTVSPNMVDPTYSVYDFKDAILSGTYSLVSNVLTVDTTLAHGLQPNQNVRLTFTTGLNNLTYGGVYVALTTPTTTRFTVALSGTNTSGNLTVYSQGTRIYLFNSSGARISGYASWSVKGY